MTDSGVRQLGTLAEIERSAITIAVQRFGMLKAAKVLGIGKTTVYRKMAEYKKEGAAKAVSARAEKGAASWKGMAEMAKLTDQEAIRTLTDGWDLLMNTARMIAMLPVEQWIEGLDRAETVAPIVDPTLYREYIYSGKGEIILSVMKAALVLKKAVLNAQPKLAEMIEKEARTRERTCTTGDGMFPGQTL